MSFLRYGESIDPMTFVSLGASGLAHSQCSSASMSSSRLFLGRLLSSRACFHFAGRERFSKTKPSRTMIFQRTATTPLNSVSQPKGAVQWNPTLPQRNAGRVGHPRTAPRIYRPADLGFPYSVDR